MNYDALSDRMTELLAMPDADDDDSETAAQIAEVEKQLSALEMADADRLEAAVHHRLLLPMDAGTKAVAKYRQLSLKNRGLHPCGNMPQPTSGE